MLISMIILLLVMCASLCHLLCQRRVRYFWPSNWLHSFEYTFDYRTFVILESNLIMKHYELINDRCLLVAFKYIETRTESTHKSKHHLLRLLLLLNWKLRSSFHIKLQLQWKIEIVPLDGTLARFGKSHREDQTKNDKQLQIHFGLLGSFSYKKKKKKKNFLNSHNVKLNY